MYYCKHFQIDCFVKKLQIVLEFSAPIGNGNLKLRNSLILSVGKFISAHHTPSKGSLEGMA